MKKIKLVFDMDGTLLDSMDMWKNLSTILDEKLHLVEKLEPLGINESEMVNYCYTLEEENFKEYDKGKVLRLIYNHLNEFYTQGNLSKKFVEEKLKELKDKGYDMYVATATDSTFAPIAINSNNLGNYFTKIYTPDRLGYYKHDINYFKQLAKEINSNFEDIIFFDDAHYAIKLAKSLGIKTVAVYDKTETKQKEIQEIADFSINDFSEINENILNK